MRSTGCVYYAIGKRVTYRNAHHIENLYNFSRSHSETRTIAFICDQVIHSYIFVPCLAEPAGWDGVILASDRQKDRGVFYLRGWQVVAMFESVARNNPAWIRWQLNPRTGEERLIPMTAALTPD